jgi:hypothetical protein
MHAARMHAAIEFCKTPLETILVSPFDSVTWHTAGKRICITGREHIDSVFGARLNPPRHYHVKVKLFISCITS